MRLRRLEIRNFRGIESLDWDIDGDLVVIVGPGDSGKSTILDAIELVLSPRWGWTISENDFFRCNTKVPVEVTAYVAGLPRPLLSDRKFGLDLRGIGATGVVHDEPADDDLPVLAIRFRVDESYEPSWTVVNNRLPDEGKPILGADRRLLGMSRLGASPDRHLSWAQGSALARLTEQSTDLSALIAASTRAMRTTIRDAPLPAFDDAVKEATEAARRFGVGPAVDNLSAQLSADVFDGRVPSLSLHTEGVPLDRSGLGTRRLVALSLQHVSIDAGGIALIDEIEAGLEPYRLRHLLRVISDSVGSEHGQVILTTHSATVVEEVPAHHVHVVRRVVVPGPPVAETVHVSQVPESMQPLIRSNPEALFSRKIVVCEGKTEIGLLRALSGIWGVRNHCPPSHKGVTYALGNGNETLRRTLALVGLGYSCIVLGDSDVPIDPDGKLAVVGTSLIVWKDATAIEDRLFLDLPIEGVMELLEIAIDEKGYEPIEAQILTHLSEVEPGHPDLASLLAAATEADFRLAASKAAADKAAAGKAVKKQKNPWFKQIGSGELAGAVVARHLQGIPGTDLYDRLAEIEAWIYGIAE